MGTNWYVQEIKFSVYLEHVVLELLGPGELVPDWPGHLAQVWLQLEAACRSTQSHPCTVPKAIDFPRYNMKCSGGNEILRGIFYVVLYLVFLCV